MAFVSNMDDEQQTSPAQGPVAPGGTGQTVHLAPSSGIGSSGGSPTPGVAPSPAAGGQFATLDKYLAANQGQAEPLANKITGDIGNQYNNLQGQNQQILQNIQGQVSQGSTPQDQGVLSQEAANPVSFASNPSNIASFQKQLNDQYTGPTSAESTNDFSTQQANINNAIAQGTAQTSTDSGRQQLLQQYEATPTAGVTGLNSAILAQNPSAQGQIENAYQPFSNLVGQLNTGAAGIDTSIGQAQTQAQQASQAANQQIANQISALNTNVNSEYGNLQNKYNAANAEAAKLASNLQSGTLPVGYGVDPGIQTFINNNLNPWLQTYGGNGSLLVSGTPTYNFANVLPQIPTNTAPTLQQAATTQDYANAGAFQNLLAGLNTGIAAPIINPTTISQAGTYNTATIPNINNKALAADIASSLGTVYKPQPYYSQTGLNQFGGLMAALNQYQGLPWYTPQGGFSNTDTTQQNPFKQYTPTIA